MTFGLSWLIRTKRGGGASLILASVGIDKGTLGRGIERYLENRRKGWTQPPNIRYFSSLPLSIKGLLVSFPVLQVCCCKK